MRRRKGWFWWQLAEPCVSCWKARLQYALPDSSRLQASALGFSQPPCPTPREGSPRSPRGKESGAPIVDYHVLVEQIRAAYEALGTGDVEPLVALMHPDVEWQGRRRSDWRFWEPRPS